METPACGGNRDRRCVRGPRSYDLSRFDGQVESAEPRVAFRPMHQAVRLRVATCPQSPAVRGGSVGRKLPILMPPLAPGSDDPVFGLEWRNKSRSVPSLASSGDDPVFEMEWRNKSHSVPSPASGGNGPVLGHCGRTQSIPSTQPGLFGTTQPGFYGRKRWKAKQLCHSYRPTVTGQEIFGPFCPS